MDMPIKVIRCEECGHIFERLISSSQWSSVQKCPVCGGEKTCQTFTGQVIAKGSCDKGG